VVLLGLYNPSEHKDDGSGVLAAALLSLKAMLGRELAKRVVAWGDRQLLLLPLLASEAAAPASQLIAQVRGREGGVLQFI
jgi:hypothetical protein